MRLCLFTDNHWAQCSSIIRRRGNKYSQRLENQIQSLDWVVDQAQKYNCDEILCLGDFFDKSTLNSEELTALNDLKLFNSDFEVEFLVGNHETGSNDMSRSSAHALSLYEKTSIIDKPNSIIIKDTELCFLPYTVKDKIVSLSEIFKEKKASKRIIFSHNDIAGIYYGGFLSTFGYNVEDIENNCDLFINGHLHNGTSVTDKIINLGNLTGQNFSEDAFKYSHNIAILDTDTLNIQLIENPFAFNFYKIDSLDKLDLDKLKNNAVLTIKISQNDMENVKQILDNSEKITEYRIVLNNEIRDVATNREEDLSIDHLQKFREFVYDTIGTNQLIKEELEIVCARG